MTETQAAQIELDKTAAKKVLRLMEQLDYLDEGQSVSSNFKISDEVLKCMNEE